MCVKDWIMANLVKSDLQRVMQSKRPKRKLIGMLPREYQNGECNYSELIVWLQNNYNLKQQNALDMM